MDQTSSLPALSKGFITFGTITKNLRINNSVILNWSTILKNVNKSKLLINNYDLKNLNNKEILLNRFKDHGISESRLDFIIKHLPGIVCSKLI